MKFWFARLCVVAAVVVAVSADNETTSVDDETTETISEVKTEETFEQFEKRLKNGANNLVRKILPQLMKGASSSEISGPCLSSIMRIIGGLRQLREWALRFIDACGKIPPGVLEGTSLSLGDYDQCLDIEVGKKESPPINPGDLVFRGQYCLLENHRPEVLLSAIRDYQSGNKDHPIAKTKTVLNLFVRYKHLTNTSFKLGVCVPSKCTPDDVQQILNSEALKTLGAIKVAYCEGKDRSERTIDQDIIIGAFGIVGCLLLIGTLSDVWIRIRTNNQNKKLSDEKPSVFKKFVSSTSLYSNALELINVEKIEEPLRILCALRAITVVLTIYSHTYGHIHELHFQKFSKPANFLKFFESFTFSGIANGSVSMDTIVFIAGVTITYSRWRYVTGKEKVKLNIVSLLLERYFRMSAAQLLVMGLFMLLPLIGSGPLWHIYMDGLMQNCKERWWLNILFIGNFWSARQTCLYHMWILAVIMQLTLLSALILWLLKRSPKAAACFVVFLILLGIVGVAVVTIINDLPGSMAFFMLDVRTATIAWRRVYSLAYDHVGPFCIGLLTGYFLAKKKDVLVLSKKTCAVLWCLSICCTSAVLFGLYEYRHGSKIDMPLATFYAVTHRNVWSLGIAWLLVACTTGNGGPVTRVLRAKIFIPFDRLCYMAFLLHIPIMFYHSGSIRERWFMGHFELMFFAMGYITTSFLGSFVLYIACVRPFYFLEELVSKYCITKSKVALKNRNSLAPPVSSSQRKDSGIPEIFSDGNGCVNLGYSKKPDGV